MKTIVVSCLLFVITSCHIYDHSSVQIDVQTNVIVQNLQGTFRGCIPSPTWVGWYNKIEVIINDKTLDYYFELSANADCSAPYYRNTTSYEISKAAYQTAGDTENINLDLKSQFYKIQFNISWYVDQNHCGMNDWAVGVEKDVTGIPCLSLLSLYDSHHSSFRALNEPEFHKIQLKAASLVIPFGYTQSGDTASDRKESHPAEIPKI